MVLAIGIMAVTVVICLSIMGYGYRVYKASLLDRAGIQTKELCVSTAGMIRKQIEGTWYWKNGINYAAKGKENVEDKDKSSIMAFFMSNNRIAYDFTVDGIGDSGYEAYYNDAVTVSFKANGSREFKVLTKAKTDEGGYEVTDSYLLETTMEDGYNVWTITFDERN